MLKIRAGFVSFLHCQQSALRLLSHPSQAADPSFGLDFEEPLALAVLPASANFELHQAAVRWLSVVSYFSIRVGAAIASCH